MLTSKNCRLCGRLFKSSFARDDLCPKCWHAQPKCGVCHQVMAPEYGSLESFARKVGKYKICAGCDYKLRRNGYLHISMSQCLLPSGRVRTRNVPAEDKV